MVTNSIKRKSNKEKTLQNYVFLTYMTPAGRLWSTNKSNIASALKKPQKFICPILSRLKKNYDYIVI